MTAIAWVGVGLGAWLVLATVGGVVIGWAIRNADSHYLCGPCDVSEVQR